MLTHLSQERPPTLRMAVVGTQYQIVALKEWRGSDAEGQYGITIRANCRIKLMTVQRRLT